MYSELVYFEGAHFAHVVSFEEDARLRRIHAVAVKHGMAARPAARVRPAPPMPRMLLI